MIEAESHKWYSSYSVVTLERLLAIFKMQFKPDDLLSIVQNPQTYLYQLLIVPYHNMLNGIIMNQARDYQEYAQKMIIDYLMSGAANVPEDGSRPIAAKEELEDLRLDLLAQGEAFDSLQYEHHRLILDSQLCLLKFIKSSGIKAGMDKEKLADAEVITAIQPFIDRAQALAQGLKPLRTQFYEMILKGRSLLNTLPDYFNRFQSKPEYLEVLDFDFNVGEDNNKP